MIKKVLLFLFLILIALAPSQIRAMVEEGKEEEETASEEETVEEYTQNTEGKDVIEANKAMRHSCSISPRGEWLRSNNFSEEEKEASTTPFPPQHVEDIISTAPTGQKQMNSLNNINHAKNVSLEPLQIGGTLDERKDDHEIAVTTTDPIALRVLQEELSPPPPIYLIRRMYF